MQNANPDLQNGLQIAKLAAPASQHPETVCPAATSLPQPGSAVTRPPPADPRPQTLSDMAKNNTNNKDKNTQEKGPAALVPDHRQALAPNAVHRPWGSFESVIGGAHYQVKRIVVSPGRKLSLQYHHHRAEHWTVVAGTAHVTLDDEVVELARNESIFIPLGATHRLDNRGNSDVVVIEVQCGDYLGEDDIVRVEDDFGRA